MRWILLDEVMEIKKGFSVRTRSRVPKAGEFSPEILLIEMMAQTAGILMGAENEFKDNVVFAKIEGAELPGPWTPEEGIQISASCDRLNPEGSWIETQIESSRGTALAKAKLMLVSAGNLIPGTSGSITFHEAFMNHFKIREKIK